MGTLTYSGAPYPETGDANDPPADFLAFGTAIDQLLVLKATDLSDRNARYANVAAGTLVSCASLQTLWMKLTTPPTAASWATLLENTTVTSGVFTAATGFTSATQWATRRNGWTAVRVSVTRSSGTEIVGHAEADTNPSDISDTVAATLGATYWPPTTRAISWKSSVTGGHGYISAADGDVILSSSDTSGRIRSGDTVEVFAVYPSV